MKTIKIIDLFNKIANREEVPKKIEYEGEIYEFNKNIHGYWGGKNKDCFRAMVNWRYLNNEVEILEEEKKIPEKLKDILRIDDLIPPVDENMYRIWKQVIKNYNKLNEICDYLESKGE